MSIFFWARLRLTLWYVLVILVLSTVVSAVFYNRTVEFLNQEVSKVERQMILRQSRLRSPNTLTVSREAFNELKQQIKQQTILRLFAINAFIIALVGGGGYILSAKSLKPIQEALTSQRQFIAAAAHELRTPLTALQTSLEVQLLDKKLPKSVRTTLAENLEDVRYLSTLANQLLDLMPEKLRNATREAVDVSEVAQLAVKQVRQEFRKKEVQLAFSADDHSRVQANKTAMRQLCTIFLDNALKYTPKKGSVRLAVGQDNRYVTITCSDTGVGIDKKYHQDIFIPFHKLDISRRRDSSGLGLGLAIAQTIVNSYRGKIVLQSEPGVGTTIAAIFPRDFSS